VYRCGQRAHLYMIYAHLYAHVQGVRVYLYRPCVRMPKGPTCGVSMWAGMATCDCSSGSVWMCVVYVVCVCTLHASRCVCVSMCVCMCVCVLRDQVHLVFWYYWCGAYTLPSEGYTVPLGLPWAAGTLHRCADPHSGERPSR